MNAKRCAHCGAVAESSDHLSGMRAIRTAWRSSMPGRRRVTPARGQRQLETPRLPRFCSRGRRLAEVLRPLFPSLNP